MTTAYQLDLVPLPDPPSRGKPVAALRLKGDPMPWTRPKPMRIGDRITERFQGPYAKWRTRSIREVAVWWARKEPLRVPLVCSVVSVFPRPERPIPSVTVAGRRLEYPWPWVEGRLVHLGLGDVDNLAKGILDVLQRVPTPLGMETAWTPVLADDRLVVDLRSTRWWAAMGEEPCVEVRLWHA